MKTIQKISELIRQREISPVELTRDCLDRVQRSNPQLNAFTTITPNEALAAARAAEEEIGRGQWRGPLHGIPVGIKDIIDVAGIPTTASSNLFRNRMAKRDAAVVTRLKKAGAVILGKQNLHEFAYGGSSMVSCFGEVRNAWNVEHIAGGSSGGSATAVAAGLGLAAIGTDTAGSVREPASQCGVVGLKPQYGRVSTEGVIPLSVSLDHVGPITSSVADAAILLDVIRDPEASPTHTTRENYFSEDLTQSVQALRVGVPRKFFFEDLHPEVASAVEEALAVIRTMTREFREVALEVNTDRTLQSAEAYAYHREWVEKSPDHYQPETLRRILGGKDITPEQYSQAVNDLQQARRDIAASFADVDLLITPTIPVPPPTIAELQKDPTTLRPKEILLLRNTRPWNVWGVPAISIPCGFTESGLPIGLQIAGPPWREDLVLRLAYAYEQATAWHKRQPKIAS